MNEYAIIFLLFVLVLGVALFRAVRKLDKSTPFDWENVIAFAVKTRATHILIESGKPTQVKINNEWQPIRVPVTGISEFQELKLKLESLPQADVWEIPQLATFRILRNDHGAIELELKSEEY